LFLLYYFSATERRKRLLFVGSLLSVLVLVVSLALAFQIQTDVGKDKPAIIFAESSEVKSEPNMGSEVSFRLHEGTKVQIIGKDDNWVRIQLIDGKDGWIPASDLKSL
jgi:uncharacterized protein YgiM (DUF1202 family)